MQNPTVTIPQLRQIIPTILAAPVFQPIGLLAAPGVGKTDFCQHDLRDMYAEHLGVQADDVAIIIEKIGQREDASVITGITVPSKNADGELVGTTAVPNLIERIRATGRDHGIIILDEFPQAPTDVQAACSDMLNPSERKIGDWPIPDGWIVVFTGNRAADKSGAKRVLSHLRNGRALVFDLGFDIEAWCRWAVAHDANPLIVDCAQAWHDQGFFADAVPADDVAYCTPRSLMRASDHLNAFCDSGAFDGSNIPLHVQKLLESNIGPGATQKLVQFIIEAENIPSGADILESPESCLLPDKTGFQLLAGNRALNMAYDAETGEAALRYIVRLRPDLQITLGSKLLRLSAAKGWILTSEESNAFVEKFSELLPLAEISGMSI
ncbi:MAG: hypothetical protein ACYSW8_28965 [Planctomycetota bacterium]|jgi:hypothetical protein